MTGAQLPIWDTGRQPLALRYHEWRRSVEGQEVARLVERYALDQLAAGSRRISINQLFEAIRAARRVKLDNSYRAALAREILHKHPELAGKLRVKGKRAA